MVSTVHTDGVSNGVYSAYGWSEQWAWITSCCGKGLLILNSKTEWSIPSWALLYCTTVFCTMQKRRVGKSDFKVPIQQ
eukprot:1147357-Pelagomonas_calceolata.AAC.5